MLIDTKLEIINQTIEDMREAEDALNIVMGRLPAVVQNDILYTVLTDLRADIERLEYIARHLAKGEE